MIGIYCRQSIEKKDSLSIDAQIEKCIQLCQYKGWEYAIYKDSGYSGKDINRPDFERMLDDLKAGNIKTIITYRLDRISRNIADFGNLMKLFEQHNVDFISVTENFDTSTPMGRAMVMIIMVFAQLERETIAERIKDNCYYRAKLGRWTGGAIPFGYSTEKIIEDSKSKTMLVINPEESDIIKKIYDMYLEVKSVRKIVSELNNAGIKTKNNANWTQKTMSFILKNPLYTMNTREVYEYFQNGEYDIVNNKEDYTGEYGCMSYGNNVIIGEHQGIISGSKWVQVQNIMDKNKSLPPRTGKGTSILSGLVKCGICGYSMLVTQSLKYSYKRAQKYPAENITYRYFKCGAKLHQGFHVCKNTSYRADKLEKEVVEKLKKRFKSKKFLDKSMMSINENNNLMQNKQKLHNEITIIDKEIENLISNLSKSTSDILIKKVEKRLIELETKRNTILKDIEKIKTNIQMSLNAKINSEYVLSVANNFEKILNESTDEELKPILKTLIRQVIVTNDDIKIDPFF